MREQLLSTLGLALAAAITAASAMIGQLVRQYIARKIYALDTLALQEATKAVVADLQVAVDNAKNPKKPGKWSTEIGASLRIEAVRRVKAMCPLAAKNVLTSLGGDADALDALIGAYVEAEVRKLRKEENS